MVDTTLININDEFINNNDSEVMKITSIDRSYHPMVWFKLKGINNIFSITGIDIERLVSIGLLSPIKNNHCSHEWKAYIGFTESFKYCIKCNEKDK